VLAVLRSDARALSAYLRRRSGHLLADGFEADLLAVPAEALRARHDAILADGHRLISIRSALETIAATLRLEMRRTFEHDLPAPDAETGIEEMKLRLVATLRNLRPALQNAILFLARSLGVRLDEGGVFDEKEAKRTSSERLRRDVWIFAQILRAFALKARHANPSDDRWAGAASFQFVKEFLAYFRAMGYPLLRRSDYPRFDGFLSAIQQFLTELFEQISRREELADVPFDRRAAANALKLYLGTGS
jgi:hypothetical protein